MCEIQKKTDDDCLQLKEDIIRDYDSSQREF
jgi:hypothetical protein